MKPLQQEALIFFFVGAGETGVKTGPHDPASAAKPPCDDRQVVVVLERRRDATDNGQSQSRRRNMYEAACERPPDVVRQTPERPFEQPPGPVPQVDNRPHRRHRAARPRPRPVVAGEGLNPPNG
jgi:hypothetical protein